MRKIVLRRTDAPFAMSLASVNSLGEWLTPPALGTKIMPVGAIRATSCASCPAPLGMSFDVSPRSVAAFAIISRKRESGLLLPPAAQEWSSQFDLLPKSTSKQRPAHLSARSSALCLHDLRSR